MILVVCIDDNNGMMFNHRRQSQDRILRERLLEEVGDRKLWMDAYSGNLFLPEQTGQDKSAQNASNIIIDENFLAKCGPEDYCFVEDRDVSRWMDRVKGIVLFRWNRTYPADRWFRIDWQHFRLVSSDEFAGSSHEKITREIYRKCE